jgi:ankyrin repeat protein
MQAIVPTASAAFLLLGACAHPPEYRSNRMLGATAVEMFGDARVAALAQAACDGNASEVAAAVRGGVDPNSASLGADEFEGRVTALLWAIDCDNTRGVEALLRAGANPNQATGGSVGLTSVLAATDSRNPALLRLILQNGGDPNATTAVRRETALMRAFDVGLGTESWENWQTLLDAGANIEAAPNGGHQTVATHVALINRFDKVVELLERGYSYDLIYLGFVVQRPGDPGMRQPRFPVPLFPATEEARTRALALLAQRGVRFPVSREDVGIHNPELPAQSN